MFGDVLRENTIMLQMARELGFAVGPGEAPDIAKVTIDLAAGSSDASTAPAPDERQGA
jgi:hypothetical protein